MLDWLMGLTRKTGSPSGRKRTGEGALNGWCRRHGIDNSTLQDDDATIRLIVNVVHTMLRDSDAVLIEDEFDTTPPMMRMSFGVASIAMARMFQELKVPRTHLPPTAPAALYSRVNGWPVKAAQPPSMEEVVYAVGFFHKAPPEGKQSMYQRLGHTLKTGQPLAHGDERCRASLVEHLLLAEFMAQGYRRAFPSR